MRHGERGESLVEVVVATAIIAVVVTAVVSGALAASHQLGAQPVDEALRHVVASESRVAVDVLKYQGSNIAAATIATSAPVPSGSPIPIHLTIGTSPLAGGGLAVTVSARADGGGQTASMTSNLPAPAPLPSSEIAAPSAGQAPI